MGKNQSVKRSTTQSLSIRNFLLLLVFSQMSSIIFRLISNENKESGSQAFALPESSSLALIEGISGPANFLFPLMLSGFLSGRTYFPQAMSPMVFSIAANLPATEASWFGDRWNAATKSAGLFGNALKSLFSPSDYFMPNDSLEKLAEKFGSEVRLTIQESGTVAKGVIEKAGDKANEFVINLGEQGRLTVEKIGSEFRFTADSVLKSLSREGQVILSVAGVEARLTIKEAGTELRSIITHAGDEVRSVSYEIPRLTRLAAQSFIAGITFQAKDAFFGTTKADVVKHAIESYIRENKEPNLEKLLEFVFTQNHIGPKDKVVLYSKLIEFANLPYFSEVDRNKLFLLIGAVALSDAKLVAGYWNNYALSFLADIPSDKVRDILASGDEKEFLNYFGMLPDKIIPDGGMPIGAIVAFPEHLLPGDFVECDGREFSSEDMKELYNIIGDRYGSRLGEGGKKYFNIPDYRGHFLRGFDHGDDGRKLGEVQEDTTRMPRKQFTVEEAGSHNHGMDVDGEHDHRFYGTDEGWPKGDSTGRGPEYTNENRRTDNGGKHKHHIHFSGNHVHGLTGGDPETRPKNKNVKFMIKYQSSAVNLHKQMGELKKELKETRESLREIRQTGLFFATAAATGGAIMVAHRYLRK